MKRELALLALLAVSLYVPALGSRDLWNPNEPLYATVVAEMAAAGEGLVPRANGEPFGEKPILYFWLALGSSRVTGAIDELSLRLPAALSGLALVLGTALLVEPYAGRRRAVLAGAVLATSFVVFWSARQVQMDLTLAACTAAALVPATRVIDFGFDRRLGWSLAGVAAGLGLLTKGPVGAICPALAIGAYVIATRPRPAFGVGAALGWSCLGAAVVAGPWYAALWIRGEHAVLAELLLRQNVERFLSPWDHAEGIWYYVVYLWVDLLPWSPLLLLAVGLEPSQPDERKLHRLAWCWLGALTLFFTLSASKRSPYLLPAAPAASVLVAAVVDRVLCGELDVLRRRACRLVLAALAGVLFLAVFFAWRESSEIASRAAVRELARHAAWVLGGLAACFAAAAAALRRWPRRAATLAFAGVIATYFYAAIVLLPRADAFKSPRAMAEEVNRLVPRSSPLAGFHVWRWRADWSYYARRPIPVIQDLEALAAFWHQEQPAYLLVERGSVDRAREVIGSSIPLAYREAGDNAAYLFTNRAAGEAVTRQRAEPSDSLRASPGGTE